MDIQTDARRERYIESAFGVPESERKEEKKEEKDEEGRGEKQRRSYRSESTLEKILAQKFRHTLLRKDSAFVPLSRCNARVSRCESSANSQRQ